MDHDVWRYVSHDKGTISNHRGHMMYLKEELARLEPALPSHWWYYLDEHGEGQAVVFPIKIKPLLTWTPSYYIWLDNKLQQAPRIPQEKLLVTIARRCCNTTNL